MSTPDLLRYLIFGLAMLAAGGCAFTLADRARTWVSAPRGSRPALLRVVLRSAGVLGVIATLGVGIYDQLGQPGSPRLVVYAVALGMLVAADWPRRRRGRHR